MILAFTTISPKTHHARVDIRFDKRIPMRSQNKVFENPNLANQYVDSQLQLAIRVAITRFARQRKFILSKYPSSLDAIKQMHHVDAVLEELDHHANTKLVVLTASIHWLRGRIFAIAPTESSRYRSYYEEIIKPLVDWCSAHSLQVRAKTL